MKLSKVFAFFGFTFQFLIPTALLSTVVSFTHEGKKAGLTIAGIGAVAFIVLVLLGKLKDRIKDMQNNVTKQALLSISPIILWLMIFFAFKYLSNSIIEVSAYWKNILPFIIIGRGLYIISGIFKNTEIENKKLEEEQELIEKIKGEING